MRLFHYTSPIHLPRIRETGYLKAHALFRPPGRERPGEPHAVCLTIDPVKWYGTAWEMRIAQMTKVQRSLELSKTLVRIEVDLPEADALPWREYMELLGELHTCDESARRAGNDESWYYCARDIGLDEFCSIEERRPTSTVASLLATAEVKWTERGPEIRTRR